MLHTAKNVMSLKGCIHSHSPGVNLQSSSDIGFYNVKPSLDPGSIKVSEGTLPNVDVSDQQGKNVFVLNRKNG